MTKWDKFSEQFENVAYFVPGVLAVGEAGLSLKEKQIIASELRRAKVTNQCHKFLLTASYL